MTFKIKPYVSLPLLWKELILQSRIRMLLFSSCVIQACEYVLDHMEPLTEQIPNETPSEVLESSD